MPDEAENRSKIQRRNSKGQLTRTLNVLSKLLSGDDLDIVKEYAKKAESQFRKLEEKHEEYVGMIEDDTIFAEEEGWMADCEKEYVLVMQHTKTFIRNAEAAQLSSSVQSNQQTTEQATSSAQESQQSTTQHSSTPQQSTSHQSNQPSTIQTSTTPRMARMKFPTFYGDIKDYMRFKEMFLHCTSGMTAIERFYQLIESMTNTKEKDKIKGCININRAWEVLDDCYGDQDKLVDSLLRELEDLKTYDYRGKPDLSTMNTFVQTLQNFERQAESLGLSGELNSKIMINQIKQKLPEEHRIAYYKCIRDEAKEDSLTGLVKWLRAQMLLLEKAKVTMKTTTDSPAVGQRKFYKSSNAATLYNDRRPRSGENHQGNIKCPLHPSAKTHYLKTCNRFRSLRLEEKFKIMKKENICVRCGHNNCVAGKPPCDISTCQFRAPCRSCGKDDHFTSICPVVYGRREQGTPKTHSQHSTTANVTTLTNGEDGLHGTLPTVMGFLRCGDQRSMVRILLDGGSQATLIRKGIFPRMNEDMYQDHNLTLVGGQTITRKLRLLDCHIEDIGRTWSYPITVTELDKPCGDVPIIQSDELQQYDHLKNADIKIPPSETIDVLLGVDNTHLMVWEDYVLGEKADEPIAVKCPFGWYIQGGRTNSPMTLSNYVSVSATGLLDDFLGLERVGLEPRKCACIADSMNSKATEIMQKSVKQRTDGSYEVGLPWCKQPTDLPDNYPYAIKRMKSLEKQFVNRPDDWNVYCKQMRDQLDRGVSRRVPEEEMKRDREEGRKMWFLPHFAVIKESSKSTPVRVVYDAKARYQGHSLNDYLAKGDNINTDLFEVALRFRENEVGVIADISKMFQAIRIPKDDARFHRFVFRENPNHPMQVYELNTVTFGDKPSPTAAIVTLRHVVAENAPDNEKMMKVVGEQFYMDDLNESVVDAKEALELKNDLTSTLAKGHFNIRKWQSNEEEVCDETEDTKTATVLGIKWDLQKDTLKVKVVNPNNDTPTKRSILSQTASYYDVFGILSGVLVRPKILLQKLWQFDMDWDTPLNPEGELYSIYRNVERDLHDLNSIEIPRCLIPEHFKGRRPLPKVSLHGASDASEDAMGMGIWLRWAETEDEEAYLTFVCARAKVTPLKQTSMPRKELQAMLLLSRLMVTVRNALRFDISYSKLWTDSLTVINWLRGQSKSFRSYVSHRVGEITAEFDPVSDVAYVPTDQNVIDLVSRGGTASEMKKVLDGPEYLRHPPTFWPETPTDVHVHTEDEEKKKFHVRNAKTLALKVNSHIGTEPIIDPTEFSSWPRLKNVTARVFSMKSVPRRNWLRILLLKFRSIHL